MRSTVERRSEEAEKVVRDIRRATRRQYTAEEKVRIVIDEIDNKGAPQRIVYALVLQQMAHIEKVARMLAVKSGHDFPP